MIHLATGKTRKVFLHDNGKWVVKVNNLLFHLVRNPAIKPTDNFNRMEYEIWKNAPVKDYLMPVIHCMPLYGFNDDVLVMELAKKVSDKEVMESPGLEFMRGLSDEKYYQQEVVRPGNWMKHNDRIVMIDYAMPELHRIWT